MRRRQVQTRVSRQAPGPWVVPPHLRGLACKCCGYFFQDGETHGELDFSTGELTCKTRTIRLSTQTVCLLEPCTA